MICSKNDLLKPLLALVKWPPGSSHKFNGQHSDTLTPLSNTTNKSESEWSWHDKALELAAYVQPTPLFGRV